MFNKETEYALRGLIYIKLQNIKNHRPGTVEVSREIEAPPFFIAKILQRLVRYGFLESLKGKGGGFFFDPEKPDLPLNKLISATEGDRSFTGCGIGLKNCDENNPCPLHEKYAPIRDSINKLVSGETVQSLAEKVYKREIDLKQTFK
jgi:Rrf2 family transcriptional regulator, iron-sulfur cluster assembly transcription factor